MALLKYVKFKKFKLEKESTVYGKKKKTKKGSLNHKMPELFITIHKTQ